ncbi:MAG: BamA/TamA family outer membrane protein [candidate division KSB1 bacterium]|nr:BamA/TamA family outer membrane protein [candidate division KSB1 bacterium]
MRLVRLTLLAVCLLVVFPPLAHSQYFGKNHVQYKRFKTFMLQSRHFDIYFTEGGESIAEFVAETAEESYQELMEDFRYELTDRITIIVYNSHNDFEQTNVQLAPGEEAVGGFTEFFKNRVVIPYEGDWEKFRHVIHHELTHAVMLQMVFGSGIQSIITGLTRMQLPLWFIEGLAEYESRSWDTESDMFIRDAALNGYIPDIPYLRGFLAYKGGQSVLYYLAQKYGGEKIGEILNRTKLSKSLERGLRQSIGMGVDDLSERWQKYLKQQYWPDISERQEPAEFAQLLTDHVDYHNFVNNSPAFSPRGDKIAFLSDKSDYFDIYLMSAIDGKVIARLVAGQRTGSLEELHWLRPGISWSPDGKHIVFAAKAGGQDALHIVDVDKRNIVRTLKFDLDGVFSPTWSPRGDEIAFVGMKHGQSDIYAVQLETGRLRPITNDVFSDLEPSYSPDGTRIVFSSDRGEYLDPDGLPENFKIYRFDYRNRDIYLVQATGPETGSIERITDTPFWEKYPVFSPDGRYLAFTSDRSGIANIYLHRLDTGETYPITNVLTGISHLSWGGDGSRLAFVAFYNGGYDIYLLKNPLDIRPGSIQLQPTHFLTTLQKRRQREADGWLATAARVREDRTREKYRHYIFDPDFAERDILFPTDRIAFLDTTTYKTRDGRYKVRPYKPKFSPDIVYGNAGYSQFFGVQGTTQFSISDILGDHRLDVFTDLFYDLRNSNFLVRYFYLPRRADFGIGAFHNAYFFFSGRLGLMRDRYFGANLFASYPLSRYRRFDAGLLWLGINRDFIDLAGAPMRKIRVLMTSLSYVKDTTVWGWTGPVNGSRGAFSVIYSPRVDRRNGLDFVTAQMDYRKYIKFKKEYNFVVRIAGGISGGKHPQTFFIGGIDNWINQRFVGGVRIDRPEDIYFSSFVTPLRGADYYEQSGNRFALVNLEFRFPMIRYLLLGWPLSIGLANVRGALFTDIGGAWSNSDSFKPFRTRDNGYPVLNDLIMGYGFGSRANLGLLLLRFDVAWTSDLYRSSSKPKYYFSLGAEF